MMLPQRIGPYIKIDILKKMADFSGFFNFGDPIANTLLIKKIPSPPPFDR
jgi:hypothetical protein